MTAMTATPATPGLPAAPGLPAPPNAGRLPISAVIITRNAAARIGDVLGAL